MTRSKTGVTSDPSGRDASDADLMISDSSVLKEAQGVRAKNYRGAPGVAKTDDVWQRPHLLGAEHG